MDIIRYCILYLIYGYVASSLGGIVMIHVIVGSETFGYKRRRIVDLAMSEYSNHPICGANMFSNIHHKET